MKTFLSSFKSFFDDWNLFEYEKLQIAESGDDKHADRDEPDVMNKLDKRCAGIFLEPAEFKLKFTFLPLKKCYFYLHSSLRVFGSSVCRHTIIHNFDENNAERDCRVIGRNAGHLNI